MPFLFLVLRSEPALSEAQGFALPFRSALIAMRCRS